MAHREDGARLAIHENVPDVADCQAMVLADQRCSNIMYDNVGHDRCFCVPGPVSDQTCDTGSDSSCTVYQYNGPKPPASPSPPPPSPSPPPPSPSPPPPYTAHENWYISGTATTCDAACESYSRSCDDDAFLAAFFDATHGANTKASAAAIFIAIDSDHGAPNNDQTYSFTSAPVGECNDYSYADYSEKHWFPMVDWNSGNNHRWARKLNY